MKCLTFLFSGLFLTAVATGQAIINTSPLIESVTCSSYLLGDQGATVVLTPDLTLHYKVVSDTYFEAALVYTDMGWLGWGTSATGSMIGSRAIVGSALDSNLVLVDLFDKSSALKPVQSENGTAVPVRGVISQVNGKTTMIFATDLSTTMQSTGIATNNNVVGMIVAAGYDNAYGTHKHHASFQLDLNACGYNSASAATSSQYTHRAMFMAHGAFATLAFCVVIPLAVGAAWFRSLIPRWWIYVHVLGQCLAVMSTILAVAFGMAGVMMRQEVDFNGHLNQIHHWVGLALFVLLLTQLVNGCARPPVEAKPEWKAPPNPYDDAEYNDQQPSSSTCAPRSRREKWHLLHKITAWMVLGLSLYQVQSGLKLYQIEYGHGMPVVLLFWMWVLFVAILFVGMRCLVRRREHQTHNGFQGHQLNMMPQRDEDRVATKPKEFANVI
jgi:hypothetical protein